MSWLATWVRDLVIVVFFVSVAYMLLPDNNLRQYTRFVMGLVVIVALLTPVLNLMHLDPTGLDAFGFGESAAAEQLIVHGRFIAAEAQHRLTGEGRARSTAHVASVAELALGAAPMRTDVQWLPDGGVGGIVIVAVDNDPLPDVERAARLIAGYFGLRREQVDVRLSDSESARMNGRATDK